MNITDTLLGSVDADVPVSQVLIGAFWTMVVLDTDPPRSGLASAIRAPGHHEGPPVAEAGHLVDRSAGELLGWLRSDSPLEASVGMATFNGLITVDEARCAELNAEDVILKHGAGRRVAIVGHFPFVERVRQAVAACWVLELNPQPGDVPAERAGDILPQADVVALTGTSLINGTFDGLMELCRSDAFILLLGPSAPLTPVLFDVGIDAISGTLVVDPARVLQVVGQGATFRQIKRAGGVRLLTMMNDSKGVTVQPGALRSG